MLIWFGSYNIQNGRTGGLKSVLRGMAQANLDLGFLQETKIMDAAYICEPAGYIIVDMDVLSQHHGGVEVFYHASPRFSVEEIQKFRPNVIRFQIYTGEWRWYIVG